MLQIHSGQEWTFDQIEEAYNILENLAKEKYRLNFYPNQIEIISSEQMLDAYSSVGMPIFYSHWTFGRRFVLNSEMYRKGHQGLAYEIVINSNPCIAYLMEENTMVMQALVIAHASFGHNHFFKNNYLFKQWTDADGIIDYLVFAKKYITKCEERYGIDEVEATLDAAQSLMNYGIDKYKRPSRISAAEEEKLRASREAYIQSQLDDIWRTIPITKPGVEQAPEEQIFPKEPQENILYFIEKNAPNLVEWKRELIRIVRKVSQYFYPQGRTQLMNEGFATFTHYHLIHDLYEMKVLDDGAMLEFYKDHTNVITQPDYDDRRFNGINPYALGFAMYMDIKRVAMNPTKEDINWFGNQQWVGSGDWISTVAWAAENFKDESFILQFLSPKVIRDFKMFALHDDEKDPKIEVSGIHNEQGYKTIRAALSHQYNFGYLIPDIQVDRVDRWGDRSLTMRHYMVNGRPLEPAAATKVMKNIAYLWGYNVKLESVDSEKNIKASFSIKDNESLLDLFVDDDNK